MGTHSLGVACGCVSSVGGLGEALFERDSRTVPLSAALMPHARAVTASVAAAKAEFAARSGLLTGNLSLGAADGVEHSGLPGGLGAFHRQYPGVNVHLVDGTSASLVPQVRQGSLDAAFVAVPPDGLDSGLHPHLRAASDTAGEPFQPAYATNHVALQIELGAAGAGIALAGAAAHRITADPRVSAVPLTPASPAPKPSSGAACDAGRGTGTGQSMGSGLQGDSLPRTKV
ncbi:LysR substrate-binding domain-containing protein [Streptomyces sp. NPDC059467]|uniref:LysR substrate-binding domain-containing protein n=1 Tax=Streptomyces sp. NPDC059467 TaxID=3346844 RepID=UPI0036B7A5BE